MKRVLLAFVMAASLLSVNVNGQIRPAPVTPTPYEQAEIDAALEEIQVENDADIVIEQPTFYWWQVVKELSMWEIHYRIDWNKKLIYYELRRKTTVVKR